VVERIILLTRRMLLARDPLAALEDLQALRADLDAFEREQVRRALASGASYGAVARALGISRQAAHRRYRDEFPPPGRSF
jgi:DNA invertase Pin-like site-specific DNA recombinase